MAGKPMTDWLNICHFGDVREVLRRMIADGVKATEAELAYCAGVIDSDGTIGVKKSTYAMRVVGDSGQATYSERVCVKQIERQAVDLLHRIFGGTSYIDKSSLKNGRNFYVWQVTDKKAAICLATLHPYLRIKKAQAENALNLRELKFATALARVAKGRGHAGAAARSEEHSMQMDAIYEHGKELNHAAV